MAHCVSHTQCPRCAKNGNDRSGNNLAVYSDSSTFCFSCGYYSHGKRSSAIQTTDNRASQSLSLPADCDDSLPQIAWDFLGKFGITGNDATLNTLLWSERFQRLVFPYFTNETLVAWQGRYLGKEQRPKWFSRGKLTEMIHPLGNKHSKHCVVVEDVLSAIKVGHQSTLCAIPLFGSHVSIQRILQLKLFFDRIDVWLDQDKSTESIRFSKKISDFGVRSSCILTELDPKCYTDSQIKVLTSHELSVTIN